MLITVNGKTKELQNTLTIGQNPNQVYGSKLITSSQPALTSSPFGILAVQFSVPVIAKINRLEREEYLFYLVQAGIAGLIPMILVWTGIVQFAVPSVICTGISFLTLAALFIFCKKDTMREFHKKLRM